MPSRKNMRKKRTSKRKNRSNKSKRNVRTNKKRTRKSRRTRKTNKRRVQRGGAYRLMLNDQFAGKAAVSPYYRCYNPVMNGGDSLPSVFTCNMNERTFNCRQPYWKPSCI